MIYLMEKENSFGESNQSGQEMYMKGTFYTTISTVKVFILIPMELKPKVHGQMINF